MAQKKDEGLNGNEKIEQAVYQLQQEPTQEQLAHTLTVIRRRMRENGQVVVAVEPNPASEQMQLRALRTADGASWWYAFTSFEEEMKGAEAVQSTFLVELEKLLDAALQVPEIQGIILNPWNRTIQLDKTLLRIIQGISTKGPACRILVRADGPFLYGKERRRMTDQAASVRSFLSRLRITAPTTLPAARATQ